MTPIIFGPDGKQLKVGTRIGKGGEGEIYAIEGASDRAIKFYTVADKTLREAKVKKMISDALAEKCKLIAFPITLLRDRSGHFVGFTMSKVNGSKALHELYSPGARKAAFPRADYRFLARTATNITRAVGAAHAANCVIGDINHSGFLISDQATATLIDADSFQIYDGAMRLPCIVGVPEYTPPELQGQRLDSVERTQNHDAFGLAVVIFQLLWMGRHPFSGRPHGGGDIPIEKAIKEFRFAYSKKRSVGMEAPPGVPSLSDFSPQLAAALESAFAPSGIQERPTARQWVALLEEFERSLRGCSANRLHHYPNEAHECPWCRMERTLGVLLFVPDFTQFHHATGFAPVVGDVASIWRMIERVPAPPPNVGQPNLTTPRVTPSAEAIAAKRNHWKPRAIGAALVGLAIGIVAVAPQLILLAVIAAVVAVTQFVKRPSDEQKFVKRYEDIQAQFMRAEQQRQARSSTAEFDKLKSSLTTLKTEFDGLGAEMRRRINAYNANRREEHLNEFLEKFQIRQFKIPQIGPAKLAVLTSYGIETAADVTSAAVQRVPGFGSINSKPLLDWRKDREARFVYNPNPTQADHLKTNMIKAEIAKRGAEIKAQLSTGPERLSKLAAMIRQQQLTPELILQQLHEQKTQAVADLNYLGLPIPNVAPIRQATSAPMPAGAPRPYSPGGQTAPGQTPGCPSCGGRMILRTARRGRGAGRRFYGCARYPGCRGTRSYP